MSQQLPDGDRVGNVGNPAYWLVSGLEWPEGRDGWAEAAVAVVPGIVRRGQLSSAACQVLGCADLYAARHGLHVVFFSDLTRVLTGAGTSWVTLGIDWEAALAELRNGPHPAMYLTISYRAYLHVCGSAARVIACSPSWAAEDASSRGERELVRHAITRQLAVDWPPYLRSLSSAS
jgi:hypothetical protein